MERLPLVVLQEILRCLVPWSCSKDELSEMADRMWRAQAFKGHLPPAARSGKIEASGQRIALGRCIFSSPTPPESAEPAPLLLNLVFLSRAGPQAHAAVGWLTTWMPDHIAQVLHGFALQGQLHVLPTDCCNAHRNAYASAVRRRDAAGLHWIINEAIILPTGSVWNHRDQILQLACGTTWMPLIQHISHLYGFGNFWPNIVAWNMRAIGIATAYPTDLPIWPRSLSGLNQLIGRTREARLEQRVALCWGREIIRILSPLWPALAAHAPVPLLEAYIVEWMLCELSKETEASWRG
ncbi:unnamed protein product [Symbiodinium microadriaticum]|nr:unnamed protein product [Symbiodinium microadriaticum]